MTTEETGNAAVQDGVEINAQLLVSVAVVNEDLANDATLIRALRKRVLDIGNHNDVDLVAALSDPDNASLTDDAGNEAIDAILLDLDLQEA